MIQINLEHLPKIFNYIIFRYNILLGKVSILFNFFFHIVTLPGFEPGFQA